MRLPLIPFIAALGLASPAAAACTGTNLAPGWTPAFRAEVAALADTRPFAQGRYFEVSKGEASSVLFGTIHLNTADVATPPPALTARIEMAEEVFIEVTAEEEKRMMRSILLSPGQLLAPRDKKLRDHISAKEWAVIEPLLEDYGIPPAAADSIAPWYLTITLANPACLISAAATGEVILDRRIERQARDAGIAVTGLETYEEVFGMFKDMPYDDQIAMLRAGIPTYALAEDYLATTKRFYLDGEIQRIWAFGTLIVEEDATVENAAEVLEAFFEKLLVERNERWMEVLVPAFAQGGRVAAVGALHLGGEDGLLKLLEAEGFAIRRLD